MRLFADDSILYREIEQPEDHSILQKDLEALADWSSTWLMHFNIKKLCHSVNNQGKTLTTPEHHFWWSTWKGESAWLPWSSYLTRSPLGCPLPEDQTEGQPHIRTAPSHTFTMTSRCQGKSLPNARPPTTWVCCPGMEPIHPGWSQPPRAGSKSCSLLCLWWLPQNNIGHAPYYYLGLGSTS